MAILVKGKVETFVFVFFIFLFRKQENMPVRRFATNLLVSYIAVDLLFAFFDVIGSFTKKVTILRCL